MKKLLFMFVSVMMLVGCSVKSPEQVSVLTIQNPNPPTVDVTVSTKDDEVKVKRLDLTSARVTYLTSEVNSESVNKVIGDIQEFNNSGSGPIYLILDSPGGSVIDGARLITAMQASKSPIYAVDTGLAASMAFVILEHANQRLAVPRSVLMAHPASIGLMYQGELDKAVSRLSFLKRFVDKMDYYIAARSGMTYEEFKLRSNREFWIDSSDALKQHFLDGVVSIRLPVTSMFGFGTSKLNKDFTLE